VEAQVSGNGPSWDYCAPASDYEAARAQAKQALADKVSDVRQYVQKMQKAEAAAKAALEMFALCHLFQRWTRKP